MTATPDDIALLVQTQYDALPPKRKPVVRDNGLHEWVPLSGIVAEGTTPPHCPSSISIPILRYNKSDKFPKLERKANFTVWLWRK